MRETPNAKCATAVFLLLVLVALISLFGGEVDNRGQIARLVAGLATEVSKPDWTYGNASIYGYDDQIANANNVSVAAATTLTDALWTDNF